MWIFRKSSFETGVYHFSFCGKVSQFIYDNLNRMSCGVKYGKKIIGKMKYVATAVVAEGKETTLIDVHLKG